MTSLGPNWPGWPGESYGGSDTLLDIWHFLCLHTQGPPDTQALWVRQFFRLLCLWSQLVCWVPPPAGLKFSLLIWALPAWRLGYMLVFDFDSPRKDTCAREQVRAGDPGALGVGCAWQLLHSWASGPSFRLISIGCRPQALPSSGLWFYD